LTSYHEHASRARLDYLLDYLEKDDLDGEAIPGTNGAQATDKEEASALLEEALTAYQEAQSALDQGETDPALSKLDEAYGLILKADTPPDSDLCQEKNDLRIFIAQSLAPEVPMQKVYGAIWWFVIAQLLTMILFIVFPQIVMFLPNLVG
jgi:predicted RNase H-like HicB family nuclease